MKYMKQSKEHWIYKLRDNFSVNVQHYNFSLNVYLISYVILANYLNSETQFPQVHKKRHMLDTI